MARHARRGVTAFAVVNGEQGARTMPTMRLHLLGGFRLVAGDTPLTQVTAPRLQALLAYLALRRASPQHRQHLAFMLWPDTSDAQARTNLRQLLHALRLTLPEADEIVRIEGPILHWRSDAPVRLDVADFEAALAQAESTERQGDAPTLRAALEQAVALYHGDLLPNCYDDWIQPERERLRQAYAGALERLLQLLEDQGEPRAALASAQRLLRHDPLREETYRDLMRLYAACGDRAGARRVHQTCAAVLERELGMAPSAATQQAYEQSLKMDAQARPMTTGQAPPAKTNLPVQLTSFIGRARELEQLKQLLQVTRLLTLTGTAGTGKTRLALRLAADVQEEYAAGVWLVELAPLADPALLAHTVATALGVREPPGRPILDALCDYLRPKTLLVLLDNCEHLIEPCAYLTETLLRAAPNLRILATSREALGIAGETAYRAPPLTLPDLPDLRRADDFNALAQLAQNDCMRLFVERATAAYPPFRLTPQNAPAIAQIGRRLDGIPLAIELAAARARVFTPEQIAARLDDRFRLLTGGSRTALPRHQTLLALVEWSHNLLTDAERTLLRRLSVFSGGWTLEAAHAVCGAGLGEEGEALDTLARLVDKSLVEVDTPQGVAEARYRLLETIRQYAREKLFVSGEAEQVRDRHLDFFLQFAEGAEPKLRSAEQLAWLERLETEHDNLRAALAWALESATSARALRLAGALAYFWELRGYWSEGHKRLSDVLAFVEREQAERDAGGEPSTLPRHHADMAWRAKALYGAARIRFGRFFEPPASRAIAAESLRLWRELGDQWWMAVALEHMGFMSSTEGGVQMGRDRLEEGVALAREVADRWPLAVCLVRLGTFLPLTEPAVARAIREEAVAVARSVGDKSVLSQGLVGLATDHLLEGDLSAAAPAAEEALANARAIGSVMHVMLSLLVLVITSCLLDDLAKANAYRSQVWAVARETGSTQWLSLALLPFGLVASFSGQTERGVRLLAATETLLRQHGINISAEGMRDLMILKQALDTALEKARTQLDAAVFEAALREGRALTAEQAIALATEDESDDLPLPEAGRGPGSE
jgi:predicted ATPase/DNA-binding SARP family transcriptional activator